MDNSITIRIFDIEGNSLLNTKMTAPFIGLQAGETFWFGSDNNRTWAKIIKITYGLDSDTDSFIIEMIIEKSKKSETKTSTPEYTFIDHGEKKITSENGGSWQINNGEIIVTVGEPGYSEVKAMTLQVNSSSGPIIKTEKKVVHGDFIEIATNERKVICTLVSFRPTGIGNPHSTVRVTESKLV